MKKIFIFLMFFFLTFVNVNAEGDYVTAVTVDGVNVSGIDNSKEEQTLEVSTTFNKETVNIVYTYDKDMYQCQGIYSGPTNLDYGRNEKTLTLTNKNDNSDKRIYHLIIMSIG